MKGKRGSGAATVIGIIVLLIIFYIIFLPPEEREALLEEEAAPGALPVTAPELLLDVPIGRLSFVGQDVFDHPIPNLALVETRNAVVLATENPFVVRRGLFTKKFKTIVFTVPELENTENVILSFQAPVRFGVLEIYLNGVQVFEGPVLVQNPPPIPLQKGLLNKTNTIEFRVSGGLLEKKYFSFTDIKIIGDITDISKQIATNTFTISDMEYDNLERAYLSFYPICDQDTVEMLDIVLNGKTIHSATPACESLNRQDVFKEDLRPGKNVLIFKLAKGTARIEQIKVRTTLKPVKTFIDYFNINATLYNDIRDGRRIPVLYIEFVDDGKVKTAEINLNGRLDVIDQRTPTYTRNIANVVREGNNYIELRPLTELNIVKLQVRVE